jgi:organic hydroperoxide reductase OsmC/OhrA
MKPLPHQYEVHLTGTPTGYARLSAVGVPETRTAPPAAYDGPGDAWSPEHSLLASVQACFLFTLRAIARLSKVEFTNLELGATGTVDRKDGVTRFTEITLRPRLTVAPGHKSRTGASDSGEEREDVPRIGLSDDVPSSWNPRSMRHDERHHQFRVGKDRC